MSHDIFFDEATHTYLVDGQEVPSVTDILSPLHKGYAKVNPSVLEYAKRRGTAVHEALEVYDLGGELEATPETAPYISAYLDFCEVYRPKWTEVEQIVYDDYFGFIGTLDRVGRLNGTELAVVDIKTSQPTKEALVSACLQTTAYTIAYDFKNLDEIKRYGLFLNKDGTYRVVDCQQYEQKYDIDSYGAFIQLLQTRTLIDRILKTGGKK